MLDGNRESCFVDIFYYSLTPVSSISHRPKHEATRYERAEGLSTSIKNPKETISLVEKSTGFLFYAYVF